MDGATLVGLGAMGVAGVQAFIYWQQKKAQEQANRQALFDRRYQLYKTLHARVSRYVEAEGRYSKADLRQVLDDIVQEAEFVFPKKTVAQFNLVRDHLVRHSEALPEPEYDFYGDATDWPDTPESKLAMEDLKAAFEGLPATLEVMRLTK